MVVCVCVCVRAHVHVCVCVSLSLSIYISHFLCLLSIDEHLGYFHVFAFVNNAAMHVGVQIPL